MKLSTVSKLILEDYPDEIRSWFRKLVLAINPFLEQVYSILTNGVTLKDNLKAQVIKQTLPAGTSEVTIAYNLNERPTSVVIGQILTSSGSYPTNQITLYWTFVDGQIKLKFVNLNSSTEYLITVIAQV